MIYSRTAAALAVEGEISHQRSIIDLTGFQRTKIAETVNRNLTLIITKMSI
jgi:hypothetical protein